MSYYPHYPETYRACRAHSEMLQFGYRMNRFDKKTQRTALTTFLDRVPSNKFDPKQVDEMIVLGANINDQSSDPRDEDDKEEKDKIGDNVLIRYVKVTPWCVLLYSMHVPRCIFTHTWTAQSSTDRLSDTGRGNPTYQ